jgi:hypothetical protein
MESRVSRYGAACTEQPIQLLLHSNKGLLCNRDWLRVELARVCGRQA